MTKLATFLSRLWVVAALISLAGVILATGTGVLSRTFETNKFAWSFEVVGISFIWITVLGTVMAEAARENVSIDLLDRQLGSRGQAILALVRHALTTLIALALIVSSWAMLQRSAFNPTPVMRLPMWVQHASVAVLGIGIIAVQFRQALKIMRTFR
jgi:TRAP-type C4-dicarboxylate transport system permease small subunit